MGEVMRTSAAAAAVAGEAAVAAAAIAAAAVAARRRRRCGAQRTNRKSCGDCARRYCSAPLTGCVSRCLSGAARMRAHVRDEEDEEYQADEHGLRDDNRLLCRRAESLEALPRDLGDLARHLALARLEGHLRESVVVVW